MAGMASGIGAQVAAGAQAGVQPHKTVDLGHLHALERQLRAALIGRDTEVRGLLVAALSKQNVLLLGPPGTAKSMLTRLLAKAFGGPYFELLFSRFTQPEEVFGPLSIKRMIDEEVYVRNTSRYLPAARLALSHIVSRDCSELDDTGVAKGAIESALENGADAIFASLFWFALLGGVGVLLHRFSNTLDAMWGYRSERFNYFGRCAARCDDVLNFIPARLTALSYVLLAQNRRWALRAWREQAPLHDSPNAGPVMAAGAGALGVTLGGAAVYHGQIEHRPDLGFGPAPVAADIKRAIALIKKTIILWVLLMSMLL